MLPKSLLNRNLREVLPRSDHLEADRGCTERSATGPARIPERLLRRGPIRDSLTPLQVET